MNAVSRLQINQLQIHHQLVGENGPMILMLHGWGANLKLMQPLAERLAPCGYQVCLLDLPGFGDSDPPPSPWSVHDYANFVAAYLDQLGLKPFALIGHSFGGRIGLILGAEQPSRLSRMILIDSAGVRKPPSSRQRIRLQTYRAALRLLTQVGLRNQAERLRAWYSRRYGSADYQAASGVMRETLIKVVNEDLLPYAAQVGVPTLLFWGERDEDTPLWQGRLLEKTIPDAGLVVWPGSGHYSYLERLDDTARVIDHFLKQS